MASQPNSPEFDAIEECTYTLVRSIKDNVDTIGRDLYNVKLLSEPEYTALVTVSGPTSEAFMKAVKIITAVRSKVERNPKLYDIFVGVLSKHGSILNDCVQMLSRNYAAKVHPIVPQVEIPESYTPNFTCPYCRKCSIESFLRAGCSNPSNGTDTQHFPFLTGIREKDRSTLEADLVSDFEKMRFLFSELRRSITKSNSFPIQDVKSFLLDTHCFPRDMLTKANSMIDIMIIVCKQISLFNYDILKSIIIKFGSGSHQKYLHNYQQRFNAYSTRDVTRVPTAELLPKEDCNNSKIFALQYSPIEGDSITLKQVKTLCGKLADELGVSPWDLKLVSIQQDCVLLFSLRKSKADKVLPITSSLLDLLDLTLPYSDIQFELIAQTKKEPYSKYFGHESNAAAAKMYQTPEAPQQGATLFTGGHTHVNGFDHATRAAEQPCQLLSSPLENGTVLSQSSSSSLSSDGLSPSEEVDANGQPVPVDSKNRRLKRRMAFKKKGPSDAKGVPPDQEDWDTAGSLTCDYCLRTLLPGHHLTYQDKPYCNACHQLLFGISEQQSITLRQELLHKIDEYNMFKQSKLDELQTNEVNGQLLFEGVLKIYWGLKKPIRLASGSAYAKARNNRDSIYELVGDEDANYLMMLEQAQKVKSRQQLEEGDKRQFPSIAHSDLTKPTVCPPVDSLQPRGDHNLLTCSLGTTPENGTLDFGDDLTQFTMSCLVDPTNSQLNGDIKSDLSKSLITRSRGNWNRFSPRKRSASFRRISRQKKAEVLKEHKPQDYTPPYGESTNLRVSNAIKTIDVLKMLLTKFKIKNDVSEFSLCVFYDNGHKELCKEDDYPLKLRLKLGPSEEIAKLFVVETSAVDKILLPAGVAEWIKFSMHELEVFCTKFTEEEQREERKLIARFEHWRDNVTDALRLKT